MVDIFDPNAIEDAEQFGSVQKFRNAYEGSKQEERDNDIVNFEEEVAPNAKLEEEKGNHGQDGFFQSLAELPVDIAIGGLKAGEEVLQALGAPDNLFGLPAPDDTASDLIQKFSQYAVPYALGIGPVSNATKAIGFFKKHKYIKQAFDAAVTGLPIDALALDPQDGNMFNFLVTSLGVSEDSRTGAAIREYLAVDPADSDLKARAKNALSGIIGSVMFDMIIRFSGGTIKTGYRAAKNILKSGDTQLLNTQVPHVDDLFSGKTQTDGTAPPMSDIKTPKVDQPSTTRPSDEEIKEVADEMGIQYAETIDRGVVGLPEEELAFVGSRLPKLEASEVRAADKEIADGAEFYHGSTPQAQSQMREMFEKAYRGEKLSDDELNMMNPFNLTKLNSPTERIQLIAQMGEIMKGSLPRNIDDAARVARRTQLDAEIQRQIKFFGVDPETFLKNLQRAAPTVEGQFSFLRAGKTFTDLQVQTALKKVGESVVKRTKASRQEAERHIINAMAAARATSGLNTSFGRGLAELKNIADAGDMASQTGLIKANMIHDIISSTPELSAKRLDHLDNLEKLSKLERQSDPDSFVIKTRTEKKTRKGKSDEELAELNVRKIEERIADLRSGKTKVKNAREKTELEESLLAEEKALKAEKRITEILSADDMQARQRLRFQELSMGAKTRDILLEVYVNGLLSSIKTSVVNFTGNSTATISSIFERAYAGATNDQVGGVTIGEAVQLTWSYVASFPDFWRTAWYAAKNGPSVGAIKNDLIKVHNRSISGEILGIGGNLGKAINKVGAVINLPGRALLAMDEAFKMVHYRAEINALSYRKARNLLGEGADHKSIALKHAEIKNDVLNHKDILEEAKSFSELNTFTNKLPEIDHFDVESGTVRQVGGLSRTFKKLLDRDRTGLLRTFIPFFQTPVNLLSWSGQRTPFIRRFSDKLMGELKSENKAIRQLAEARVATGNMMWATTMGLAMTGTYTGAPPFDHKLRQQQEDAMGGSFWYSRITKDGWVPYDKFDPLGIMMAGSANMANLVRNIIDLSAQGNRDGYTAELMDAFNATYADAVVGTIRLVTDRHYLQGFGNLIDMLTGDSRGFSKGMTSIATVIDPTAGFYSSFRRNLNKGINPQKQVSLKQAEEEARDPVTAGWNTMSRALIDMFENSQSLLFGGGQRPPARNHMGEVKHYPATVQSDELHLTVWEMAKNSLQTVGNPFAPGKRSNSPVMHTLARLGSTLMSPAQWETIDGIKLSQDEHTYLVDVYVELNKSQKLDKWVQTKSFNEMPEAIQLESLENRLRMNQDIAELRTSTKFDRLRDASLKNIFDDIRRDTAANVVQRSEQSRFNPLGQQ